MEKTFSRGRRRLKKVGRESMCHIYMYITMLYIIRVRRIIRETPVQVQSPKSLWHRLSSSAAAEAVDDDDDDAAAKRIVYRVRLRIYTILLLIIIQINNMKYLFVGCIILK